MSAHSPFLSRLVSSPSFYLIVLILALGFGLMHWVDKQELKSIRDHYGLAAAAITLPAHIAMALTPFPADLFSLANGALYGVTMGTLLTWLGWWVAALLQYGVGRRTRTDFQWDSQLDSVPAWLRRFPVSHPLYLILVRLVPYLGMHLGSFLPGATGVPWQRFLWCSAIGTFPGSLLMTAVGAGLVRFV